MSHLIGIPLVILFSVLQSVVINDLTLLDGRPDLILLVVMAWAISGRPRDAMVWALIGGLFLDLLSDLPFGITAINLIVVVFLVSLSEGRFWESHFLMPMGVTLVASLLYHIMNLITLWIVGKPFDVGLAMSRIIFPSTFLNLLLALPAAQLAKSLHRTLYPPEVKI